MSKQAIFNFLNAVSNRLKQEQQSRGIRASGRSARSLKSKATNTKGQLTGSAYFQQQEEGRGPTKKDQGGILRQQIREWIDDKNLPLWDGFRDKDGMSYVITRNIHRRGTLRGRSQQYPGLPTTRIIKEERGKFVSTYRTLRIKDITSEIVGAYKG